MSIEHELLGTHLTSKELTELRNVSTDFYKLAGYMDKCSRKDIVKLLLVELEGRNRPSYISRIYGRYRKMLPHDDMYVLTNWRQVCANAMSSHISGNE
jgi:hypothetical protein